MNQLLDKLKAADKRMIRISRGVQILYLIMVPLYAIFYIWNPGGEMNLYERLGGGVIVIALFCFALIFRLRIKRLKSVDYALPTTQMLAEATKRFKLWKPELKWALLTAALMDIGVSVSSYNHLEETAPWTRVVEIQYIMIPALLIGLGIGIIWWHFKYKPLRDHAQKLLNELTAE
ncbi:hypothetical protein [Mangrovibacterium diazotrophicum]|uniref:Uncharacterized protein n=1 Tax=Mangrovibacterium diazotrophicum TaxID=1261403 RepID=A0A419VXK4_9BACT|nr:hypothetical protein [Mangrovibacterium diazotrophicum]RKD87936.1 hypothetical protein BC643_3944 [Mangrovibacterium diazotrophicum]